MSNLDHRVQNTPVTTRLLGARNSGNREDPRGEDVVSLIHSILLSFLLKLKKKKKELTAELQNLVRKNHSK